MTTKKLYSIIIILIAIGFAAAAIMILLMPEQVPMHYNASGEVDRMGSKYENLVFPICGAVIGFLFIVICKSRKVASFEEKVLLITGVFVILLFNILGVYFMYKAIVYVPGTALDIDRDVFRLTFIALGVLLVVLGNLMPKFRRNYTAGLRTPWSMSSDSVWQKSNRFAGISAVACGLAMIICAAILTGTANIVVNFLLLALWTIASVIASYRYYKAEK